MSQKIGVVGTGYVGLVTGTCLADVGNTVLCIDVDPLKVEKLSRGEVTIYEPGLDHVLERNVRENRITFSLDLRKAVAECSILMFCLPTPPGKDGEADLAAVMGASHAVANLLNELNITEPRIVINKSTVPVGTTALVAEIFREVAPTRTVDVVSNPEFLSEGFAVEEFMKPDRVIVGTSSLYAEQVLRELYEPFVADQSQILVFDEKSAEVTKYAANSMLATKISFMNELSKYCDAVGANIENIRKGIGADDRIGKRFIYAGIGYGGSCFPKDVKAIAHSARQVGSPLTIIEAVESVNKTQREYFIDRIKKRFKNNLEGKVIALWGLAFKPNTDDVREAPAFTIISAMLNAGAKIVAFDPEAHATTALTFGNTITYATSMYEACLGADVLVIATEWNEFRKPDFEKVKGALVRPLIFDGRNIYDVEDMKDMGFEYHSVGRNSAVPE